jgi:hypothetical protein
MAMAVTPTTVGPDAGGDCQQLPVRLQLASITHKGLMIGCTTGVETWMCMRCPMRLAWDPSTLFYAGCEVDPISKMSIVGIGENLPLSWDPFWRVELIQPRLFPKRTATRGAGSAGELA